MSPGVRGPFGAVVTDSRKVVGRDIFFALVGERFDAHDFVPAVVAAGAGLLVVSRLPEVLPADTAVVLVDDTLAALQALATALLDEARARRGGLRVIGITGSNGKTSVKQMVAALLVGDALATPGNLNNHIGLPLTVTGLCADDRFAVLEMGANGPDDIVELVGIARPDVGAVTSIAEAHVAGFGGLDGVRRAKAGIAARGVETLVLPAGEAAGEVWRAAAQRSERVVTVGSGGDYCAERDGADGRVRVTSAAETRDVALPVIGAHNATNLATALAIVDALGVDLDASELQRRLDGLTLPGGRLRRVDVAGRNVIDDAYNANPASMRAALDILSLGAPPRVAVLGEMRELGDDASVAHREVGAYAASRADVVIVVGDEAAAIAAGAGDGARRCTSLDAAAAAVADAAPSGATVLLKASRGAALERLVPKLRILWEGSD